MCRPIHILRTVGANDEQAAAGQVPAQVKEQAGRGGIDPVQVIQDQDQGAAAGHGS